MSQSPGFIFPSAFDQLIGTANIVAYEGIGRVMADAAEEPMLRNAMLLRTTSRLRDALEAHSYDADESTPVAIDLQDAALLLDVLLRKLA